MTTVRKTRGDDIDAACGQLAGEVQDRTHVRARACRTRRSASSVRAAGRPARRPGAASRMSSAGMRRAMRTRARCSPWSARCCAAACATHRRRRPPPQTRLQDRVTASDETDATERARVRLELAAAVFRPRPDDDGARPGQAGDRGRPEHGRGLQPARPDLRQPRRSARWPRRASGARCSSTRSDADTMHNYGWYLCQQKRYRRSRRAVRAGAGAAAVPRRAAHAAGARACARPSRASWARPSARSAQSYELDPANPATAVNLSEVLYRRGELERARFYIAPRQQPCPSVSNAQTLWLAARIEHALGNRQGAAGLRHAVAQPVPGVARGGCSSSGARSMSEAAGDRAAAGSAVSAGACCARRAQAQGLHIAALAARDQGRAAQARGARSRPLRRTARRHLHARAGADRVPRAEDRRRRRCWRCCRRPRRTAARATSARG